MKITIRYTDSDYLEFLRFINYNNANLKIRNVLYKILIPCLIILSITFLWDYIYPYTLPTLIIGFVIIILWLIFSTDIYYKQLDLSLYASVKKQYSNSIEFIKDTTITLTEDKLIKDIEGCHSSFDWSVVDKVFVTENYIFIKLATAAFIMVPLRFFNDKEEQAIFLKFIDSHIRSTTGLQL